MWAALIAVTLLVALLAHRYVWVRLGRDPAWPPALRRLILAALIVLGALMILSRPLAYALPREAGLALSGLGLAWGGLLVFLASLLGLLDLGRKAAAAIWRRLGREDPPSDPGRRVFLARSVALATGGVAAGMGLYGAKNALGEIDVREVGVRLAKLPPALSGLTVVQLTDLHVGPLLRRKWVQAIVEKVNALRPDLVVLTGDLMDGAVPEVGAQLEPLAGLRARWGAFFVTGNHEYYSGVEPWMEELGRLGLCGLENARVVVGDRGDSIDLAGVHDYSARRARAFRSFSDRFLPDLDRALADRDPERALILLAHQPRHFSQAVAAGVDLQISGHTHGGQIWPFVHAVKLQAPWVAGLSREGASQIYVSRGTGFWGPPMRIGAPAEITKIVLST